MTLPLSELEKAILYKLFRHKYIGGRHTPEENIPKGLGDFSRKDIKKALKKLNNEGYLLLHPKKDAMHVSIHPRSLKRVMEIFEID